MYEFLFSSRLFLTLWFTSLLVPTLVILSRNADTVECMEKLKKYETAYARQLKAKYFSKKALNGGSIEYSAFLIRFEHLWIFLYGFIVTVLFGFIKFKNSCFELSNSVALTKASILVLSIKFYGSELSKYIVLWLSYS